MSGFPGSDSAWQRYPVAELGIVVEFPAARQIETALLEGTSYAYQNIREADGSLFLRYGERETLDDFVARAGDALTRVTAGEARKVELGGMQAERVDLTLDTQAYALHRHTAEGLRKERHEALRTRVSVCGFRSPRGIPVLIGYRIPESHLPAWRDALEHALLSPRPLP
jgi:hypothetical protein